MKTLIAYYSLEGNTRSIAQELAPMLNADLLELTPSQAYPTGKVTKYLFGGKSAVMGEMPVLEPYGLDPSTYDTIILGTPVWASRCSPPVSAFANEQPFVGKRVAAFACAMGKSAGKTFEQLEELCGVKLAVKELFISPNEGKDPDKYEKLYSFVEKVSGD